MIRVGEEGNNCLIQRMNVSEVLVFKDSNISEYQLGRYCVCKLVVRETGNLNV